MSSNRKAVLGLLKSESSHPISCGEIAKRLHLPKGEKRILKNLLIDLLAEGSIVKIRGGRYGIPSRMNLVTGELSCHPKGFGFVLPEGEGDDLFINPRGMHGAMHRDRVVARVERTKSDGRREGKVIRILERGQAVIVGRFEKGKGFAVVIPSDERVLQNVMITPRGANGANHGDIVEVEVTKWPDSFRPPSGRVREIVGCHDDPDVEIEIIVRKHGLSRTFPAEVVAEAEKSSQKVSPEEVGDRVDLRKRRFVTIDGETAKDFDDAVSVERIKKGYRLWVSIADVSHYVRPGSALDEEAYRRGTSVYLPDNCIPMLPEQLSNGICSLNPHVDRLAFTAEIEFDKEGLPQKSSFYESVIRSHARLTYNEVKSIIVDDDETVKSRHSDCVGDLLLMDELSSKLKARRSMEGSIDFDLPEPQVIIDLNGKIEDIVRSEQNRAHQLIEDFMLAANRAVALRMEKVPFLYRVHDEPDGEKVKDFLAFVHNFGYKLKGREAGPHLFKELLEKAKGRPEERLINHLLLRSMKQAIYSEENRGHFGLAFDHYTHFTSPIRRYPDLIVHRLLKRMIGGKYGKIEQAQWKAILPDIADQSSLRERGAMEAERDVVDLKKAEFMRDKVGEQYDGLISGVTSFGLFVELKEYFVEGLIHISQLRDGYYTFAEKEHALIGEGRGIRFRIGDPVRVEITGVDMGKRQISMELASEGSLSLERAAPPRRGNRKGKRRRDKRREK
ncbi:MAG: ribonuclease R [Deltaproteobacteria bacterium]|nr:ribonuclease R [Deltaproteobacteria bacterium]